MSQQRGGTAAGSGMRLVGVLEGPAAGRQLAVLVGDIAGRLGRDQRTAYEAFSKAFLEACKQRGFRGIRWTGREGDGGNWQVEINLLHVDQQRQVTLIFDPRGVHYNDGFASTTQEWAGVVDDPAMSFRFLFLAYDDPLIRRTGELVEGIQRGDVEAAREFLGLDGEGMYAENAVREAATRRVERETSAGTAGREAAGEALRTLEGLAREPGSVEERAGEREITIRPMGAERATAGTTAGSAGEAVEIHEGSEAIAQFEALVRTAFENRLMGYVRASALATEIMQEFAAACASRGLQVQELRVVRTGPGESDLRTTLTLGREGETFEFEVDKDGIAYDKGNTRLIVGWEQVRDDPNIIARLVHAATSS